MRVVNSRSRAGEWPTTPDLFERANLGDRLDVALGEVAGAEDGEDGHVAAGEQACRARRDRCRPSAGKGRAVQQRADTEQLAEQSAPRGLARHDDPVSAGVRDDEPLRGLRQPVERVPGRFDQLRPWQAVTRVVCRADDGFATRGFDTTQPTIKWSDQ
jgi:hypothetical protein